MGEADRFSLEALRHIHKQLDDDNDGGIEVNESVEVSFVRTIQLTWAHMQYFVMYGIIISLLNKTHSSHFLSFGCYAPLLRTPICYHHSDKTPKLCYGLFVHGVN